MRDTADPLAPDATDTLELPTDASILSAVGRGHSLASALSDLIDNSIDAGATRVGIRFVMRAGAVRSIRIRDDGCGMTAEQLERAMSLGRSRDHGPTELGHFGVGLKAASLSQARILTVLSTTGFSPAAGLRLDRAQTGPQVRAQIIDAGAAAAVLERRGLGAESGTVVEWSDLENVSEAGGYHARRNWFETMIIQLRDQLGLTFHRLLGDGRIKIELDELDEASNESGAPRTVRPIDPFAFERWGADGYPKRLEADLPGGGRLAMTCFVLPPAVDSPAVKMLGRPRGAWQGLYVYRNDRLLHSGGWLQLHPDGGADTQLARAAIDITTDGLHAVAMNAEKRGVLLRPVAIDALTRARSDGFSLRAFIEEAQAVLRNAQQRELRAQPFATAGTGSPDGIADLVERTVGVRDDGVSVSFEWAGLASRQLYAFEPTTGVVQLNEVHRVALESEPARLELLKTSVYLLLEPHAGKERLAAHTRERLDVVHAALAAVAIVSRAVAPGRGPGHDDETALPSGSGNASDDEEDDENGLIESVRVTGRDPYEPLADPAVADVHIDDDIMVDLMRRVREFELLTAEEEVELARQIEAGVIAESRLARMTAETPLTQDRLDLAWIARNGERAFARMVASNLRLVVHIARRYQRNGLDLADLTQEGSLGLLRAVQKFDRFHGTKFSTYATWWIRQGIERAIADQGRTIRFPVHVVDQLPAVVKAWKAAQGTTSQRLAEVSETLEVKPEFVRAIVDNLSAPLSLDWPVLLETAEGESEWVSLADELVDADAIGPEEHVEIGARAAQLKPILDTLTEREADVLRWRFGVGGAPPMTLDQIGARLGVTRERARQIESKTMKQLRSAVAGQPS
ncbi:sigma-70 family RNA polymerase sigma factor [Microbacterium dauci]|uniref:Sigma-70 family RNA polymerase sigma factor n=1 Tax=Microbacterium dauci TaxID=3048008 RepID=A0ABT6ZB63_9MICO|nr:sigma-70 family RNA polymerase sigma factor [Microbacterium sp. LX3-4]MDJ1113389.1 sigma-70 family RNA polymerase sigma factor [Microbacterium sp. LX3-4]